MKEIREYLRNQRDISTTKWIESLKSDEQNIITTCYYNQQVIFWSEALERFNKVHGDGKHKK